MNHTAESLFDLVAPIAICGGADCTFEQKALDAWEKIREIPAAVWSQFGVTPPMDLDLDLEDNDDFIRCCNDFAYDAYSTLFETLVGEHGPAELEAGYDYYGAKGFKLPGDSSKGFTLSGDSSGFYPWYETAALLIERLKQIVVE
jgi:hypothetical protein